MKIVIAAAFALLGAGAAIVSAQPSPARTFEALRQAVSQAQADAVLQARVLWNTDIATVNAADAKNRFTLTSAETVAGSLRRDRAPQVSSTSLVIVSQDDAGRELDWRVMQDPRVVRAEATRTDTVNGERLYYVDIDLLLQLPALPETSQLAIYSVRAVGGQPVLDLLGTVRVQ